MTDCSGLDGVIGERSKMIRESRMAKERRTAQQLADIITERIGVRDVEVRVRWDHSEGWCPTIVRALTALLTLAALRNR